MLGFPALPSETPVVTYVTRSIKQPSTSTVNTLFRDTSLARDTAFHLCSGVDFGEWTPQNPAGHPGLVTGKSRTDRSTYPTIDVMSAKEKRYVALRALDLWKGGE